MGSDEAVAPHGEQAGPGPGAADAGPADAQRAASILERLGAGRPGMPVCLITGFLGAGKTTLVNHILANSQGVRAAVFVNEYGSVDVDGALIRSRVDETRVISLTNGCVCCEVNEDLAKQLSGLLKAKRDCIDVVIIETSGVCDPEPVLTTLRQIEDVDEVHLDTVVCVVDATTASDPDFGASADAKRQLAHADVVLLNKVDLLADESAVDAAERKLQAYSQELGVRPVVLRTEKAEVDLSALLGLQPRRHTGLPPAKRPRCEALSRHSKHSRFSTFAYKADRPFDVLRFEEWASNPPDGLLRAKGLLWMRGIPRYVCFHLAGRRTNPFETLPVSEQPSGSEIVFVSREGAVDAESIAQSLDKCLG